MNLHALPRHQHYADIPIWTRDAFNLFPHMVSDEDYAVGNLGEMWRETFNDGQHTLGHWTCDRGCHQYVILVIEYDHRDSLPNFNADTGLADPLGWTWCIAHEHTLRERGKYV